MSDDLIEDEVDGGFDGFVEVAVPPALPAAPAAAGLRAGRVVLAVETTDVERAADALVWWFAGLGEFPAREHPPLSDLRYWAAWDADRARLATAADVVVCGHDVHRSIAHAVSVDLPAELADVSGLPWLKGRTWLTTMAAGRPDGPPELQAVAAAHAGRTGGRALAFPGQHRFATDLPVTEALERTAVDEIVSSAGEYAPDAVVRTYGYARPGYEDGRLRLRVGFDDPRFVVPWEVRFAPPCCGGDH